MIPVSKNYFEHFDPDSVESRSLSTHSSQKFFPRSTRELLKEEITTSRLSLLEFTRHAFPSHEVVIPLESYELLFIHIHSIIQLYTLPPHEGEAKRYKRCQFSYSYNHYHTVNNKSLYFSTRRMESSKQSNSSNSKLSTRCPTLTQPKSSIPNHHGSVNQPQAHQQLPRQAHRVLHFP